jgi:hypothetical protein
MRILVAASPSAINVITINMPRNYQPPRLVVSANGLNVCRVLSCDFYLFATCNVLDAVIVFFIADCQRIGAVAYTAHTFKRS